MVGLSGGGGGGGEDEKVQSQIKKFMVWIFMGIATSPCGGVWGPPPIFFRNMKCFMGDSRPT